MRKFTRIIFHIFAIGSFLIVSQHIAQAQRNIPKFKHLTIDDGLSQNSIYSIFQDSNGFMWFGTRMGGLNRYDGYSFTTYKNNKKDTTSISGNEILSIYEDRDGFIWVGTRDYGLNKYNIETDKFQRYYSNESDSTTISHNTINYMVEDEQGKLWLATNKGLCSYNKESNTFSRHLFAVEEPAINIKDIEPIANNLLWLSTRVGLYLYNTKTHLIVKLFQTDKDNPNSISQSDLTKIDFDVNGKLWVGTRNMGINRLDDIEKGIFTRFTKNSGDSKSIDGDYIRTVYKDDNGVLWIGTRHGIDELYPEQQDKLHPEFILNKTNLSDPFSLNQNSVYSFFASDDNIIWVGTYSGGVNYALNDKYKFKHIRHIRRDTKSLSNDITTCFAEDKEGVWIGTDGGGLNLLNRKTGEFTVYNHEKENPLSLQNDFVQCLFIDKDKDLWVGTQRGLHLFNRKDRTFRSFLKKIEIRSIQEGENGKIWIATEENLFVMDKNNFNIKEYKPDRYNSKSISYDALSVIFKDSQKRIWIGTNKGLNLYNRLEDNFTTFFHTSADASNGSQSQENLDSLNLSHSHITSITEDLNGRIWVGTFDGLNMFDETTNRFRYIGENEGLANNVINGVLCDNNGNIWLSTNHGLSKFNPDSVFANRNKLILRKKPVIRNYDTEDGLQNNEFIQNAAFKSTNGEMYFGGINGFNVFYPDSIMDTKEFPRVYITNFKISNNEVPINTPNSPLSKPIWLSHEIKLNYKQSNISFGFNAINYKSSSKNKFAYKLEGYDKKWNYIGNKREANYTNIPASNFTLKVMASNEDGIWNEESVALKIELIPPFWETWLFRIFMAIIFIGLIILYFTRRLTNAKRLNQILEKTVKNRTQALLDQTVTLKKTNTTLNERQQLIEQQAKKLTIQRDELGKANDVKDKLFSVIAHDLKNPFSAILGFNELLSTRYDDYTEAERKIMIRNIYSSSNIIYNLILSLLDWSRSQMSSIAPKFEMHNIIDILKSTIKVVAVQSGQKKITIKTQFSTNKIMVQLDSDLIKTVIRNLLSNAIKFSPIGSEINVTCKQEENQVVINIIDNGVGINKNILSTIFSKNAHETTYGTNKERGTGLGLSICKDFITLHNGNIWAESEPSKGSIFSFSIPLQKEKLQH